MKVKEIKWTYMNWDYVDAVKKVAKRENLIWNDLSDFYVDVKWVCQTTKQYLSDLLKNKDEEIYQEYRKKFQKQIDYWRESNKYVCYKYQAKTDYSEGEIRSFYEFEKIWGLEKQYWDLDRLLTY